MIISPDNKLANALRTLGTAMYGSQWISPMAMSLGISRENFRKILGLRRPANPEGILADAKKAAIAKRDEIQDAINKVNYP